MSAVPEPTIRMRLDPTNPGQFLACCGLFELADRAWAGAEGWFAERADFFYLTPLDPVASRDYSANALLHALEVAALTNTEMTDAQMRRLDELGAAGKRDKKGDEHSSTSAIAEKSSLEDLWAAAKDAALQLGPPFDLRVDWYLDDRAGAGRFKTWAGQQTITDIAFGLKQAVGLASFDDSERDWLFARIPCESLLHFDATGAGTDMDVGFSFDPLKIRSPEKRALVELLAFFGLQRFPPRQRGKDNAYIYSAWREPHVPEIAHLAARDLGWAPRSTFEFSLLYRTKYLKSFLPAQRIGEHR